PDLPGRDRLRGPALRAESHLPAATRARIGGPCGAPAAPAPQPRRRGARPPAQDDVGRAAPEARHHRRRTIKRWCLHNFVGGVLSPSAPF
ncbi:hypothetical protein EG878_17020, partial [Enterococcus faecalis]